MLVTGTTVASVQALASGSTDISYITADSAIAARSKGADLVAVWGGQTGPSTVLIVQPNITSYEQSAAARSACPRCRPAMRFSCSA